jgi:hypothetical protein
LATSADAARSGAGCAAGSSARAASAARAATARAPEGRKVMTSDDRIDYTEPFRSNVNGRLKARFRLDAEGKPQYEEQGGLRHFYIDIFLSSARTDDIKEVKYFMNDATYLDPNGYSNDGGNEFREQITSYGDVEIVVTVVKTDGKKYEQRAWLSNMLENGHATDLDVDAETPKSRAIRAALQRIRTN